MRVAMYRGVKSLQLEEQPDPQALPGEVIVRVKYCGICGTDVHAFQYEELYPRDTVLGHETVGTIVEVGKGVQGWNVGDRVAGGFGGFAEYMKVRNTPELIRIPDAVTFEDAVLWDPISVPLKGIHQSRFRLGDNVVVTGAGPIGLFAVQLLKLGGARHITVLEPVDKRREFALQCGADAGLNPLCESASLTEKIFSIYNGKGVDISFECAGTPQALQVLLSIANRGGQILLLGVTNKETPIVQSYLIRQELDIKGSLVFSQDDIRLSMDLLAQRRLKTRGVISDIVSLDDIIKAINRLSSPDEGLIKVLVAP